MKTLGIILEAVVLFSVGATIGYVFTTQAEWAIVVGLVYWACLRR